LTRRVDGPPPVSGSMPKAIPPALTLGQEMFSSRMSMSASLSRRAPSR
jgi:hypothetical protein